MALRRRWWVLGAFAVVGVVAVVGVAAALLWPRGGEARYEVRAAWFGGTSEWIPASEETEPTGTAVDAGPLVLRLEVEASTFEPWRDDLLHGAPVYEAGALVGIVQRAAVEELGLVQALTLGPDSADCWVSVVPPPDVAAVRLSDDEVTRRTAGWSESAESLDVQPGTAVWLLSAWGDVVVGEPAVLLEHRDGQVVVQDAWSRRMGGEPAEVVAVARMDARGGGSLTAADQVGPLLGGVVAVEDGLTVASTGRLPPGTEVVVTARGFGGADRVCRYRTVLREDRYARTWSQCSRALEACGLGQDHYYTPLRVSVAVGGDEPAITVSEPSREGGSVQGAVRNMHRHVEALGKDAPPERIEVLVEPVE